MNSGIKPGTHEAVSKDHSRLLLDSPAVSSRSILFGGWQMFMGFFCAGFT